MKPRIVFFFYLLFYFLITAEGQSWIRIYGGINKYSIHTIFEHYDKGYLLTGQQYEGNNSFGWILKTDINGFERWSKSFGKNGTYNRFYGASLTSDGGVICIGGSDKMNSNCTDPLIVKLNVCGEKEWCKVYNSINCNSFGIDITIIPGGGYMALIQDWVNGPDVWLFRLDTTGELIWAQNYVTNSNIFWSPASRSLLKTSDSCFVITGHAYSPDSITPTELLLKIFLVKANLNGDALFQEPWGNNNGMISEGQKTIENNKHILFTAGRRIGTSPPTSDLPALFKSGTNGQPISYKDMLYMGLSTTINWLQDSTLVIGTDWQDYNGGDTASVVKTDSSGNIVKTKILMPNENILFYGSDVTYNNRLVLVGNSILSWLYFYIFKLNSDLEFDSTYSTPFTYDSLCPHPIVSDTILMDDCETVVVGIDDPVRHPEKTKIYVYPNPAKNTISIEMPQYLKRQSSGYGVMATTYYHQWNSSTLEIYDLFGKLMYSKEIPKKTEKVELEVSSWRSGMYVARVVFMNEVVAVARFVVE